MKYDEVLKSIYARNGKSSYYTLNRVEEAAEILGNPQRNFPVVHITGSNGKGSVARTVFEVLHRSGFRVGLYTSPHLHRYTERIRIGRKEIPRKEVIRRFERIEKLFSERKLPWLTFFEITTLIGFEWFADEKVDIAVVEVGLGGRLDATNICTPLVSVITSISHEHTNILGTKIEDIAREKSGIIKEGVPVVTGKMSHVAEGVISRRAGKLKSQVRRLGKEFFAIRREGEGEKFDYIGEVLKLNGIIPALKGEHQIYNCACACAAIEELIKKGYKIDKKTILRSVESVTWPGRLEIVGDEPEVVFDCAHNYPAMKNLVGQLNGEKFHIVFGALVDKPIKRMFDLLRPLGASFYISAPKVHRAPSLKELARRCGQPVYPTVTEAFESALREAKKTGKRVLVTGSIFVVAEAREKFLKIKNVDPPVAM